MLALRMDVDGKGRTWWFAMEGRRVLGVFGSLAEARDAVEYERHRRARPRPRADGRVAEPPRGRPPQVAAEAWMPVVDAWLAGTAVGIHLAFVDGEDRLVPWDGRDPRRVLTRFRDAHRPVVRRPRAARRL